MPVVLPYFFDKFRYKKVAGRDTYAFFMALDNTRPLCSGISAVFKFRNGAKLEDLTEGKPLYVRINVQELKKTWRDWKETTAIYVKPPTSHLKPQYIFAAWSEEWGGTVLPTILTITGDVVRPVKVDDPRRAFKSAPSFFSAAILRSARYYYGNYYIFVLPIGTYIFVGASRLHSREQVFLVKPEVA